MPLDLLAKTDEQLDADDQIDDQAPVQDSTAAGQIEGPGNAFIAKFRAMLDAAVITGIDMAREEFHLLLREYLQLGPVERYAVQARLSASYSYFAGFENDDYDGFVNAQ
jgi:hypothetical protein